MRSESRRPPSYTRSMPRPDRVRLVVLFGGQSAEHEVSCVSAFHVLRAVDQDRYDLEAVGITREGDWVRADDAIAALHRGAGELPAHRAAVCTGSRPPAPRSNRSPPSRRPSATTCPSSCSRSSTAPAARTAPCRGCSSWPTCPSSAPACSARRCAWTSSRPRTSSPPTASRRSRGSACATPRRTDVARLVADAGLRYPLFVKPANLGSSVGREPRRRRSRARSTPSPWPPPTTSGSSSRRAPTGARSRSPCSATPRPGRPCPARSSPATSSTTTRTSTSTVPPTSSSPPTCPPSVTEEIQRLAVEAFTTLRCDGMARVDFFYEEDDRGLLINEVNTIPGFTPDLDVPQAVGRLRAPVRPAHRRARRAWRSSATNAAAASPRSAENRPRTGSDQG